MSKSPQLTGILISIREEDKDLIDDSFLSLNNSTNYCLARAMKIEEAKEKKEIEGVEMEMEVDPQDEPEGSRRPQPWTEQITVRGFIASILIGAIYSVIVMKLNLTTGLAPNFNVSAALLAFVFVRSWTKCFEGQDLSSNPLPGKRIR
ncbi:hypothetical protein NC651_000882 [Populus alba x Populus x berolinensis]|nr:hypothetical protein NC651_000882 [Populus alba x Populus x berolinensis]